MREFQKEDEEKKQIIDKECDEKVGLIVDDINVNNVLKCSACYSDIFNYWFACNKASNVLILCMDCFLVS